MSDRTPGSVRSGSPAGGTAAPKNSPPDAPEPASATQSIPGTGTQRAQSAAATSPPAEATSAATASAQATPSRPTEAGLGVPGSRSPADLSPTAATAGPLVGGAAVSTPVDPRATQRPAAEKSGRSNRGSGKVGGRGPRRARLQLRHIDTWSALKISLVLSIALFFIWMVAVGILYGVLNGLGVFKTLNDLFGQFSSVSGSGGSGDVITPGIVFGGAAVIGAINVVLMTALCTVGTFIYNLCSDLVGGLEITLSERD